MTSSASQRHCRTSRSPPGPNLRHHQEMSQASCPLPPSPHPARGTIVAGTARGTNTHSTDVLSLAAAALPATSAYNNGEQLKNHDAPGESSPQCRYAGDEDHDHPEPEKPFLNTSRSRTTFDDPADSPNEPLAASESPFTSSPSPCAPPAPPRTPANKFRYCFTEWSRDPRYRAARRVYKAEDQVRHARAGLYESQPQPRTPCPPARGQRAHVHWDWNPEPVRRPGSP